MRLPMAFRAGGICAGFAVAAAAQARPASFMSLGSIPGTYQGLKATSISSDGRTIVGEVLLASGTRLFMWTEAAGLADLGTAPGWDSMSVKDVSGDGSVVVCIAHGDGSAQPFLWTAAGGFSPLPNAPGSFAPEAISDDGTVIAGSDAGPNGHRVAARWLDGAYDTLVVRTPLPPKPGDMEIASLSADGSVQLGNGDYGLGLKAFFWVGPEPLAFSMTDMWAHQTSADGSTVVGEAFAGGAVRWDAKTDVQPLGALPGFEAGGAANDVSDDGLVIVGRSGSGIADSQGGPETSAFIWTPQRGVQDLQQALIHRGVTASDGWKLHEAVGISGDGAVIVGHGSQTQYRCEGWRIELPRCDADVAPANYGDGEVGVDDLSELIGLWGECGGSICLGDVTHDGVVDVDDLFRVINAWGECSSDG